MAKKERKSKKPVEQPQGKSDAKTDAKREPGKPLISDDRAQEIFDQLGVVTSRRTECEAAKERASTAKKDLDTAQGRLKEMLYDARSGQSRLFGEGKAATKESAPAEPQGE